MLKDEQAEELYKRLKFNKPKFDEAKHCTMILKVMSDPKKSRLSAFCVDAGISDKSFYNWLKESELFLECYALGKMMARERWEKEGEELRDEVLPPGSSSNKFQYWRMIGWSRFGVGKNSRIRLDLDPNATPYEHYNQIMKQASNGDFTAGEIKQLLEAVNVGLNAHQVFMLQQEIDRLKADLATMNENTNGDNPFTNKRITEKD